MNRIAQLISLKSIAFDACAFGSEPPAMFNKHIMGTRQCNKFVLVVLGPSLSSEIRYAIDIGALHPEVLTQKLLAIEFRISWLPPKNEYVNLPIFVACCLSH